MESLQCKLTNSPNGESASLKFAKAARLKFLSDSVYIKVEDLKNIFIRESGFNLMDTIYEKNNEVVNQFALFEHHGETLFYILKDYSENILRIDSAIYNQYRHSLLIRRDILDGNNKINKKEWLKMNFENNSVIEVVVNFDKFLHDIRVSENSVMTFLQGPGPEDKMRYDVID